MLYAKSNSFKHFFVLFVFLSLFVLSLSAYGKDTNYNFSKWADNSASLNILKNYIKEITNEKSENYIPIADRIAVFDMDGTILCELYPVYFEWLMFIQRALYDEDYNAPEDVKKAAIQLQQVINGTIKVTDEIDSFVTKMGAKAFSGFTAKEHENYVHDFMKTSADGFKNLTRGDAFYQPMLEIIYYLQKNDFLVYIVTGADRFTARVLVQNVIDIPPRQVIGTDISIVASNQNGNDGLGYVYSSKDLLQRGDTLIVKNLKMNKVSAIFREIGQQPVLAFGNSGGDASMLNYTINNNSHKSLSFLLINDDTQREYGDALKSKKMNELADKNGWIKISMSNDFKTIYGDDVVKTD